jgi:ubiquinone/menaquinone biosynthesis C-methylase UbiE
MIETSEIDWNEIWKEIDREKKENDEFASCAERWSDSTRCRSYNRKIREENWKDGRERVRGMRITPASRVLDIGAGPGTLAIPLAGIVRHVTAIEPSHGMLECLRENMAEYGIENISVIQKKWEDIDSRTDLYGPYDVVVASYSLGFPDLRAALEKMDRVSEKYVYIFWFADMMSHRHRAYQEIWEDLFGVTLPRRRMPNIIFNLLGQMGIYANVEISRTGHITRYPDLETAIADQKNALKLTDERQVAILSEFLHKTLREENGEYLMDGKTVQAKIWWEKI